jgi:signal transduction histidine kinase
MEAGLVVVALLLTLPEPAAIGTALVAIPILVYGWLGARIAARAPGNAVGWQLSIAAMAGALGVAATAYHSFGRTHVVDDLPLARAVHVLGEVLPMPVVGVCLLVAILSFPDGRLPSPRWRPVVWLVLLTGAAAAVAVLGGAELIVAGLSPTWARTGVFAPPFPDVVVVAAGVAFLLAVASLAVRARRASAEERRPIRGLLISLLLMASTLPIFALFAGDDEHWLIVFPALAILTLGILVFIPFSISIAMLRYGLFEYEVGIRKALARHLLLSVIVLLSALICLLLGTTVMGGFLAGVGGRGVGPVIATAFGGVFGILFTLAVIWARRFADRVVYRERATPYEVLSEFSGRVGATYSLDDVLPRMSLILASGTGASIVRIWLAVDGGLRTIASFPPDAPPAAPIRLAGDDVETPDPSRHAFAVRHQGELLGAIDVTMPANDPMNHQKERLVRDLTGQAGLVLRNVGLLEDVRESRRRIVAAQDERARRLERDIHDGAQQQLVALTVKLRLAEQLVRTDPDRASETLAILQDEAAAALEDLRDLARGIYPPLLADQGLGVALASQGRKSPVPVDVSAEGIGRFPEPVESAIYFSCLEALQNVAKYANASRVTISLRHNDDRLWFSIVDDGVGFDTASTSYGTGLRGIADRLDAIGGVVRIESTPGEGTTVSGSVPLDEHALTGV